MFGSSKATCAMCGKAVKDENDLVEIDRAKICRDCANSIRILYPTVYELNQDFNRDLFIDARAFDVDSDMYEVRGRYEKGRGM